MQRPRIITYLSPRIPAALYELIARDLGEQCAVPAELAFESRSFNDRNSRSGWFAMLERIAPRRPEEFFSEVIAAGSHLRSLELVASGAAGAAAVDSNVLRMHARPELRVVES